MGDVRVGVVGCGGIGAVHLKSWAQVQGARVVALCDSDEERTRNGLSHAPGASEHVDLSSMLAA